MKPIIVVIYGVSAVSSLLRVSFSVPSVKPHSLGCVQALYSQLSGLKSQETQEHRNRTVGSSHFCTVSLSRPVLLTRSI